MVTEDESPRFFAVSVRKLVVLSMLIVFFVCGFVVARGPDLGLSQAVANALAFGLAWIYLAGSKSRPIRSVGYRLADVELVDLHGRPASLWISTCRFLFLFGGPLNVLFDLIWLTNDPNRQTLRDKLSGTYVVRRGAHPVGDGSITYPTYFIATLSLVVPEVSRAAVKSGSKSSPPRVESEPFGGQEQAVCPSQCDGEAARDIRRRSNSGLQQPPPSLSLGRRS